MSFADDFTARPPHERLTVRPWLPIQGLLKIRDVAHLALRAHDIAAGLDRRYLAVADTHRSALVRDLAMARIRARELELALARQLELYVARAIDIVRYPRLASAQAGPYGLDRARDLADDLVSQLARNIDFRFSRDLDIDQARADAVTLARDLASADALARHHRRFGTYRTPTPPIDLAHSPNIDLAHTLRRTLNTDLHFYRARELDIDQTRAHSRGLYAAASRLVEAVTNVSGADLSQADLREIPLEGLRWSDATRWPADWADQIRQDSVELEPGLYEIHHGRLELEPILDTPV